MSNKIYVGNLSWNTGDQELGDCFAQYGEVLSARIIIDRNTNRSKGFGFIEMAESSAAEAAISALNGTELDGRNIRVNEAEDRENNRGNNRRY
ncbi:RNA recognition motif domain-containing protein [Spirochaeta isovalerica]|uniref:RNA recognition motif-containing protein n=1 Tax=Spirochaeta isovalerica TaxID=150 RepID=A0A841R314_9SPIO|nr:RNA-binding protein [Spirochaeta isovalerica]MBB6479434.1 RNA recognition motif-containing protein [Spirochaeta isovalerica]